MSLPTAINLTDLMTSLLADIINKTPLFQHIDINRILVCTAKNRNSSGGAVYAKVVPLRFEKGLAVKKYKNQWYAYPKIVHNGYEILYLIYFYIPRYFDLPLHQKLEVAFHELYHISPAFNGDVRRMGKSKYSHGHSVKHFDSLFKKELLEYQKTIDDYLLFKLLSLRFDQLTSLYKKVYTRTMKVPKPQRIL